MAARGAFPDLSEILSWFAGSRGYVLVLLSWMFIIPHDLLKLRLSLGKWPNLKRRVGRLSRLVLITLLGGFLK